MAQSSGQSENIDSPVQKNSITQTRDSLDDNHVTRRHRSSEQEVDLFDEPEVKSKHTGIYFYFDFLSLGRKSEISDFL